MLYVCIYPGFVPLMFCSWDASDTILGFLKLEAWYGMHFEELPLMQEKEAPVGEGTYGAVYRAYCNLSSCWLVSCRFYDFYDSSTQLSSFEHFDLKLLSQAKDCGHQASKDGAWRWGSWGALFGLCICFVCIASGIIYSLSILSRQKETTVHVKVSYFENWFMQLKPQDTKRKETITEQDLYFEGSSFGRLRYLRSFNWRLLCSYVQLDAHHINLWRPMSCFQKRSPQTGTFLKSPEFAAPDGVCLDIREESFCNNFWLCVNSLCTSSFLHYPINILFGCATLTPCNFFCGKKVLLQQCFSDPLPST